MTDITVPQTANDSREVVRGVDEDGNFVFEQVGFQELDFNAVFGGKTTSTTENEIGLGTKTWLLDYDDGAIRLGYTVQITSLGDPDCFMYGLVTRKDTTTEQPAVIDVAISTTSLPTCVSSSWEIQVISGPPLGLESDTLGISASSATIGLGPQTFEIEAGRFLPESSSVLVKDLASPGNYMYGTVTSYSGTTLEVEVLNTFGSGTSEAWAIRLLDGPGTSDEGAAEDYGLVADPATDFNDWGTL